MITFPCQCGATLFFGNTVCTACGASVGWCDVCSQLVPLADAHGGATTCGNPRCQARIARCMNFVEHNVCNCCCEIDDADASVEGNPGKLCRSCRLTTGIPDVSDPANLERWAKLEAAKRRLLFELDELGLPYDVQGGADRPVSFIFKADSDKETVLTGHADGVITVNLAEADSVHREVLRTQFGEPQRTLIGHMRHEIGHYYWMTFIDGRCPDACKNLFGDHETTPYGDALSTYYANGPQAEWPLSFISAYASAHPWEDFAETFGFYLDMRAVLATAKHQMPKTSAQAGNHPLPEMLADYWRLGVVVNELNRTMGLTDLLPEVVAAAVLPKIEFVHNLVEGKIALESQSASPTPIPLSLDAQPSPLAAADAPNGGLQATNAQAPSQSQVQSSSAPPTSPPIPAEPALQ